MQTQSLPSSGRTLTVDWSGGDPSWTMGVQLIDDNIFTVVAGAGGLPNSATFDWTFASNLACGHVYQFYVQNNPVTSWTYGSNFIVLCELPVAIDIKPGGAVNTFNPPSNGTTPVAILSSASFDVTTAVDRSTLTFGRTGRTQPGLLQCRRRGRGRRRSPGTGL